MTSTEKALLDLLRIAMGNGINNSLPTGVDWDKVIALAEKQGILRSEEHTSELQSH